MPHTKVTQDVLEPTVSAGGGAVPNLIINGKFAIDQRSNGAVSTGATLDRWSVGTVVATVNSQRIADTVYPGEFRFLVDVGTADTSGTVSYAYTVGQAIEGYRTVPLYWGSAQAQPITVAFEIEATLTGTFPIYIQNSAGDRSFVSTFTVNAINTRETKTFTIPGDATGTWLKTNGVGMRIGIGLFIGSNRHTVTPGVWVAGDYRAVSGCTNFMGNVANEFRLKNFRMYKGAVDLGPDTRTWDEELSLCQRYFWKTHLQTQAATWNLGVAGSFGAAALGASIVQTFTVQNPVPMRAAPSVIFYNPSAANFQMRNVTTATDCSATTLRQAGEAMFYFDCQTPVGSAVGNVLSVHLTADASI
jgi:hypothetical protein